jgi:hypothetical protein
MLRLLPNTSLICLPFILMAALAAGDQPARFFAIEVVDEETGRGVPLVELHTVHRILYVTDSAGWVAFDEPGLMNDRIHFEVRAHGYEFPADGFGYRGFVAETVPGERVRIELKRRNVAERLYRLTGGGIYRDSHLLGLPVPMENPLLNSRVLGQDSTFAVEYRGRVFWFWGDTLQPSHPLGNFDMAGATSPPGRDLDPEVALDFTYFENEAGFARRMAPIPGEGPTWVGGITVLREGEREHLVAGYSKIRNSLETYARGLVIYDDEQELFLLARPMEVSDPLYPIGHSLTVGEGEEAFVHFTNPLPLVRVRANLEAFLEPSSYQAFTPLAPGSRRGEETVERDEHGKVVWDWKEDTSEAGPGEQAALVEAGLLRPEERLFAVRDWKTGKEVQLHAGAVNWNSYRGRWILVASEIFGDSVLGEVWFAEADSPLGPWVYGQKIVSHDDYTFYNPRHHPFLDREGGRLIYFEGTYTQLFSSAPVKTPRYDYNQIRYLLDLANSQLQLPVAIYREERDGAGCVLSARQGATGETRPEFWALETQAEGTVPVWCRRVGAGKCQLRGLPPAAGEDHQDFVLAFYALAPDTAEPPPNTAPLFQESGAGAIIGYVWENPIPEAPVLPVHLKQGE